MKTSVPTGGHVTLHGSHLKVGRPVTTVVFSGYEGLDGNVRTRDVPVLPTSDTELGVDVPLDAPSGMVWVRTVVGASSGVRLEVTYPPIDPAPAWTTARPTSVVVGCNLVVSGTGFSLDDRIGP